MRHSPGGGGYPSPVASNLPLAPFKGEQENGGPSLRERKQENPSKGGQQLYPNQLYKLHLQGYFRETVAFFPKQS
jgi:hypothetical protein